MSAGCQPPRAILRECKTLVAVADHAVADHESRGRESRGRPPFRIFRNRNLFSRLSEWKWRLASIVLLCLYLIQDAADLRWEWLYQLQTVDAYKYATGTSLLTYIGWQWCLFLGRLKGGNRLRLMAFHQRSAVLVPLLFYAHSVQIGYGYLAVLSWVFLGNMVVGVASPVGIRIHSRSYMASWGAIHVALAVVAVALGIYHAYVALYYK